ncbi:hypothetical protein J6590_080363 [Homalodisca vitripennis]|nr:hypothetical protein J6590_080363 [Homalodisca vitripennis]
MDNGTTLPSPPASMQQYETYSDALKTTCNSSHAAATKPSAVRTASDVSEKNFENQRTSHLQSFSTQCVGLPDPDGADVTRDELKPDIFLLSEHGFNDKNIDLFVMENYTLANSLNRTHFKGDGVAVFVKPCFDSKRLDATQLSGISVSLGNGHSISVYVVYRSPASSKSKLFEYLESVEYSSRLEISILTYLIRVVAKIRKFRDLLASFNLGWLVNSPTRVFGGSPTAIDNVVTDIPRTFVSIVATAISDHDAQLIKIIQQVKKTQDITV